MTARRIVAAMLPLPGLLAPVAAHAGTSITIAICSGGIERTVTIPARQGPPARPEDQTGCAHFVCPRERGQGDPIDDEDEE